MANTCTQIYLHVVFAVEGRQNLIKSEHNDELQKYITGIVNPQAFLHEFLPKKSKMSYWAAECRATEIKECP